jgi:hypothetical protein
MWIFTLKRSPALTRRWTWSCIFNQVNSGGTKLSKGDLALAKICADWPEARDTMKAKLKEWAKADYHFNLDWLLRSVNTILTGEAKFQFLHEKSAEEI